MSRSLIEIRPYDIKPYEVCWLRKRGYAILDSQNVHIKITKYTPIKLYILAIILQKLFLS